MAVMDGTATFWKETVTRVFFEHHLPKGKFVHRGQTVDPGAIRKTALLTVEGENDEFCPPGQTKAAQALCTGLPNEMRGHFLQEGVGHYGVFSGSKFSANVAPLVKEFMEAAAAGTAVPARLEL
jgi:polyhydroxyalkanoate depolymerase